MMKGPLSSPTAPPVRLARFFFSVHIFSVFLLSSPGKGFQLSPSRNRRYGWGHYETYRSPDCFLGLSGQLSESDVSSMRVSELKSELKILRVDCSDCFDKESLVQRLQQARSGEVREADENNLKRSPASTGGNSECAAEQRGSTSTKDSVDEKSLLEELRSMSARALRTELASRQIRWAGFVEKEDLVRAVLKARLEAAKFSVTGRLVPGHVEELNGDDVLEELEGGDGRQSTKAPLLLDVFATWCGPCQMMGPILKDTAEKLGSSIRVAKMDSDKYPNVAGRFRVKGLPTLLLFDHTGKELDRIEGAVSTSQLVQWVNSKI